MLKKFGFFFISLLSGKFGSLLSLLLQKLSLKELLTTLLRGSRLLPTLLFDKFAELRFLCVLFSDDLSEAVVGLLLTLANLGLICVHP